MKGTRSQYYVPVVFVIALVAFVFIVGMCGSAPGSTPDSTSGGTSGSTLYFSAPDRLIDVLFMRR